MAPGVWAAFVLALSLCHCGLALDTPSVRLNNGVEMPVMLWGSGGATQENSTSTRKAVSDALNTGFPGLDCANHYHNQRGVALGIHDSGLRRKIWLQTKIEPCGNSRITPLYEGHCFNQSLAALEQNLKQLQVDQVDLTLLHSPPCVPNSTWADPQCMWPDQPDAVYPQHCDCAAEVPCKMMQNQWRALEKHYRENKTRAIGVSNFCAPCLECIAKVATVVPAVNQLQFHVGMPGDDPKGLVSYCRSKGIVVQAYSPLGGDAHGAVLGSKVLVQVAASHNISTAQLALKWVLQLGHALATSTVKIDYMRTDLAIMRADWHLSDQEMATLTKLAVAPDDPVKSMCLFK